MSTPREDHLRRIAYWIMGVGGAVMVPFVLIWEYTPWEPDILARVLMGIFCVGFLISLVLTILQIGFEREKHRRR